MNLSVLSQSQSIGFGVFLIVLGLVFAWKCYQSVLAMRTLTWKDCLPLTMLSPFMNHLAPANYVLLQQRIGVWVGFVMTPIFLSLCILSAVAGFEYLGYSVTTTFNDAMNSGHAGRPSIVFDRQTGYRFPIVPWLIGHYSKVFGERHLLDDRFDTNGSSQELVN